MRLSRPLIRLLGPAPPRLPGIGISARSGRPVMSAPSVLPGIVSLKVEGLLTEVKAASVLRSELQQIEIE